MTKTTIVKVERDGDNIFVDVAATPTDTGIIMAKILSSFKGIDKLVAVKVFADTFSVIDGNSAKAIVGTPEDLENFIKNMESKGNLQ